MKDISLRLLASSNFRVIIDFVGNRKWDDVEMIRMVDTHMIPLVVKGLRDESEVSQLHLLN